MVHIPGKILCGPGKLLLGVCNAECGSLKPMPDGPGRACESHPHAVLPAEHLQHCLGPGNAPVQAHGEPIFWQSLLNTTSVCWPMAFLHSARQPSSLAWHPHCLALLSWFTCVMSGCEWWIAMLCCRGSWPMWQVRSLPGCPALRHPPSAGSIWPT